jgi:hypothetical protein
MTTFRNILVSVVAAIALGLAAPVLAAEGVTEAQVAAAKTASDHLAIAAAYESEAAAADARAQAHEGMERTYRLGGAPKGNRSSMANHCKRLASHYRAAARDYRALAAEHRTLGSTANP